MLQYNSGSLKEIFFGVFLQVEFLIVILTSACICSNLNPVENSLKVNCNSDCYFELCALNSTDSTTANNTNEGNVTFIANGKIFSNSLNSLDEIPFRCHNADVDLVLKISGNSNAEKIVTMLEMFSKTSVKASNRFTKFFYRIVPCLKLKERFIDDSSLSVNRVLKRFSIITADHSLLISIFIALPKTIEHLQLNFHAENVPELAIPGIKNIPAEIHIFELLSEFAALKSIEITCPCLSFQFLSYLSRAKRSPLPNFSELTMYFDFYYIPCDEKIQNLARFKNLTKLHLVYREKKITKNLRFCINRKVAIQRLFFRMIDDLILLMAN